MERAERAMPVAVLPSAADMAEAAGVPRGSLAFGVGVEVERLRLGILPGEPSKETEPGRMAEECGWSEGGPAWRHCVAGIEAERRRWREQQEREQREGIMGRDGRELLSAEEVRAVDAAHAAAGCCPDVRGRVVIEREHNGEVIALVVMRGDGGLWVKVETAGRVSQAIQSDIRDYVAVSDDSEMAREVELRYGPFVATVAGIAVNANEAERIRALLADTA